MKAVGHVDSNHQSRAVRRMVIVAACVAALTFALSGTAYAVDHSGQQRRGAAAEAPAMVGSNPASVTAGAGTYTYIDWSTSMGGNNSGVSAGASSPHGAYTTTTMKCAVCHAVHYAAPGGAPVGAGQTADTLLRMTAGNACAYCHVVAGQTVNGRSVYDGVIPTVSGGSRDTGHRIGTNCTECHTGPHGTNQDTSVPSIVGYMLKRSNVTASNPYPDVLSRIRAINATAALEGFTGGASAANQTVTGFDEAAWTDPASNGAQYREVAVGLFCSQCHAGSYVQAEAGAMTAISGASNPVSGHRIRASAETTWTGKSSGSFNGKGQVAWAGAANCKSCHDSQDSLGNPGFPHSWGGTKMWLLAAPSSTEATVALPYGTTPNARYNEGKPQLSDGVCLKCHRQDSTTAGVGLSY
jgi:hypothetical protein